MENTQTIAQWQQFLQTLAPVESWLYVGAGRGEMLNEARFSNVPMLLAVEADEHSSQLLAHKIATPAIKHRNWKALNALVNNTNGQATWHRHSREAENGLLPAKALTALWPNLNEIDRSEKPAVSLKHLLEQADEVDSPFNWLTIDCLPAARLIQDLNGTLDQLDMIEMRVVIDGARSGNDGTTLGECDKILLPQGFTRLALEETITPLIGRALYGRDFKLQLNEALKVYTDLETQNATLTQKNEELGAQVESLLKERDNLRYELEDQRKREQESSGQLAKSLQQLAALEHQNIDLASQCHELRLSNNSLRNEKSELLSKLEDQRNREHQATEQLQSANAELNEKLQLSQTELKEQQRSSHLSTKLLAKLEGDAAELRERYAQKVTSEQELKDLIKELHAKLQAASHFYHKLEKEHPELLKQQ